MSWPEFSASDDRSAALGAAFRAACDLELRALKPGNVHDFAPGHGMVADDFRRSAHAAAGPMTTAGASVGQRIRAAVSATWEAVACNTNLGILLLAGPIVAATERATSVDLRGAVVQVLADLSVEDAGDVYAAIRQANPGGLGTSGQADVREPPSIDLRAAMALAADRDRIAYNYANGFDDVFGHGVPFLARARLRGVDPAWATTLLYLDLLARHPDSHIARKHGMSVAEAVRRRAETVAQAVSGPEYPDSSLQLLSKFDEELKVSKINPGTTADVTVACLLALFAGDILACAGRRISA